MTLRLTDKEAVVLARVAMPDLKPGQHAYRFAPAYSGGWLEVDSYPVPVVVNIDTVSLESGMNCLLNHQLDKPIGGIVKARKVDKGGLKAIEATAVIGNTPASKEFFDLESAEITFRPSIGLYRTNRFRETQYKHGETFQANGRTFTGPGILIDHGIISEISQVILGGDLEAKAALIAQIRSKKTMTFDEWLLAEKEMSPEDFAALPEEEQAALQAEYDALDASAKPIKAEVDGFTDDEAFYTWLATKEITPEQYQAMDDNAKAALQEEYMAAQASVKEPTVQAKSKTQPKPAPAVTNENIPALQAMFGKNETFLREAISKNWNPVTANKIYEARMNSNKQKEALTAQVKTGRNVATQNVNDVFLAGFARTFGLSDENIIKKLFKGDQSRAEPALKASAKQFTQGCYYSDLCLEALGSKERRLNTSLYRAAMQQSLEYRNRGMYNPALKASIGFSTIDAAAIIERVHQSFLEQEYENVEFVAERIGRIKEVQDFTKIETYTPTLLGRINRITESGEIPNLSFTIEKQEAKAEPYGGILGVPEQFYINDDLGWFNNLMSRIAKEAAYSYEYDFFLFLRRMMSGLVNASDGTAFFSAGHGNVLNGAGSSFSTLGLQNAEMAFMTARNRNGAYVMVNAQNLIIPPALKPAATLIYESDRITAPNTEGDRQIYGGKYAPIWSPLLGSANSSEGGLASNTAWLLTAAPNVLSFIDILNVRGFRAPIVESSTMDLAVWGTKFRVIYAYGFAAGDTRAAVLSLGT